MKTLYALVFACLSLPALADVLEPIGVDEENTVVATVPAPQPIDDQSIGGAVYFLAAESNAGPASDDVGAVTTANDVGAVAAANDVEVVATANDAGAVTTANDVGAVATANDVGVVATANDVGTVATANDVETVATANDVGA